MSTHFILYLIAFILMVLAAIPVPAKVNLYYLSLAALILTLLI